MKVSIIILSYGHPLMTVRCVESVLETVQETDYEILIFDNASESDDLQTLRKKLPDHRSIKLIENPKNEGFAKGNNLAVERASGDVLIFLNNDMEALPGWLEPLTDVLDENEIGISGSLLLYPDRKIQHAGIGLGGWGLPLNLNVGDKETDLELPDQVNRLAVTGACFAIRKQNFKDLGGFDESYFFSYEDVDLCLKARKKGLKTVLCSTSKLIHYESFTISKTGDTSYRSKAEQLFVSKWQAKINSIISAYYSSLEEKNIRNVLIFGTGSAGQRMFDNLTRFSGIRVKGFLTSFETEQKSFNGLPGYSAEDRIPEVDAILGATMFVKEIEDIARRKGFSNVLETMILEDVENY